MPWGTFSPIFDCPSRVFGATPRFHLASNHPPVSAPVGVGSGGGFWFGSSAQLSGGRTALNELPVILLVEDDQAIQGIIEDTLSEGGFEVAIAASGEEAATLLSGNNGQYQALVTDISLLGRFDGWEVARRARKTNPDFAVVYMSGKYAQDWASKGVPNSIMLAKPFALAQLVTAVSQLLNAVPPIAPAE